MNTLLGFPEGNVATAFGTVLRRWRTARGMSQLTLATEAGHLHPPSELPGNRPRPAEPRDGAAARRHARRPARRPQRAARQRRLRAGVRRAAAQRAGARTGAPRARRSRSASRSRSPPSSSTASGTSSCATKASHRIFDLFDEPRLRRRGACQRDADGVRSRGHPPLHRQLGGARRVPRELAAPPGRGDRQRNDGAAARRAPRLSRRALALERARSNGRDASRSSACSCKKDDLSLTFFSMITTLGTPRDVTLQQLKIECFFPADAATEQAARRLARPRLSPSPFETDCRQSRGSYLRSCARAVLITSRRNRQARFRSRKNGSS